MPAKRIRYGQLYNYLESLGYRAEVGPTYFVYKKRGTRLPVILPKRPKTEEASNFNLMSVQHTLQLEDVVGPGHLYFTINGAARRRKTKTTRPKAADSKPAEPKPASMKKAKPKAASTKAAKPEAASIKAPKPKATGTRAAKAGGS